MTRDQLKARIREGGGEGWQLPEDFDWENHEGEAVLFVYSFTGEISGGIAWFDYGTFYISAAGDVLPESIAAVRAVDHRPPTDDALDAMRTLSALDREGGGE
jgi:hypothetical protein